MSLIISSELIVPMLYNLHMIGIPINGPADLFCDDGVFYRNYMFAESQLKNNYQSICFRRFH